MKHKPKIQKADELIDKFIELEERWPKADFGEVKAKLQTERQLEANKIGRKKPK